MKKECVITSELLPDATVNVRHILGARVLSKTGLVVGRVKQVRINPKSFKIEGLIVRLGLFRRVYLGSGYVFSVSDSAVILNIELSLLLESRRVVDYEGRVIGSVKSVLRKDDTNDIDRIIVSSFLKSDIEVPMSAIKTIARSVMLKESYHVKQRYFWQKF